MGKLIASTFASLDGIMQAPGGPDEDPTGGFTLGGWMFGYGDENMDISASGFDGKDRELVLGRRTYEIFEAYYSNAPGRLTDRRVQRVDFSRGAWAGQTPLQRDRQAIGTAARSLSDVDHRRCDEYLCIRRRYPARFVRECRAEREGVGPTKKDGE